MNTFCNSKSLLVARNSKLAMNSIGAIISTFEECALCSLKKECFRLNIIGQRSWSIYAEWKKLKCGGRNRGWLHWNRQWVVIMKVWYCKNHPNYYKVTAKRQKFIENDSSDTTNSGFKFLNMLAEKKSQHLNVILLWLLSLNSRFVCFLFFFTKVHLAR